MDDRIRFRMCGLFEIVRAFAEIFLGIAAALVAVTALVLLMLLTVPAGPATMAAIVSAFLIRSIVRWFNRRDKVRLIDLPDPVEVPGRQFVIPLARSTSNLIDGLQPR